MSPAVRDGTRIFSPKQGSTSLDSITRRSCSLGRGSAGQDRAFAVYQATGDTWRLANFGTSGVCTDAKVPPALYGALGCAQWEAQ